MPVIVLTARGAHRGPARGTARRRGRLHRQAVRAGRARGPDPVAAAGARRQVLDTTVRYGELSIDLLTREVSHDARAIRLSTKEFELLAYFVQNAGSVLTRAQLQRAVWGYRHELATNSSTSTSAICAARSAVPTARCWTSPPSARAVTGWSRPIDRPHRPAVAAGGVGQRRDGVRVRGGVRGRLSADRQPAAIPGRRGHPRRRHRSSTQTLRALRPRRTRTSSLAGCVATSTPSPTARRRRCCSPSCPDTGRSATIASCSAPRGPTTANRSPSSTRRTGRDRRC